MATQKWAQTTQYLSEMQILALWNGCRVLLVTSKTTKTDSNMQNLQHLTYVNQKLLRYVKPLLLIDTSFSRHSTNHSAVGLTVANKRGAKICQRISCVHSYVSRLWVWPRHRNRVWSLMWLPKARNYRSTFTTLKLTLWSKIIWIIKLVRCIKYEGNVSCRYIQWIVVYSVLLFFMWTHQSKFLLTRLC